MEKTSLTFTNEDIEKLKLIEPVLRSGQTDITNRLSEILTALMFDNVHTLHPRRLAEFGAEESNNFLGFLSDPDINCVIEFGKKRAFEGLSLKSILSINSFLNQYCLEKIGAVDSELVQFAIKAIDSYMAGYIEGYFSEYRKQTLEQQKELRQALSTALEGHRRELLIRNHAINTSINAILLTDLNFHITYVNPAFLTLWGYANINEVLAIRNLNSLIGGEGEKIFKALHEKNNWRGELQVTKKDGSLFDIEMFASFIKDENNKSLGTMASFIDISKRKRLEAQFRQAQKMDALGQLAGGITHDFNNMLTAVRGYLQLILMDVDNDSQTYKDINQVKLAVDRGSGLTKQLRYFAREASGERAPTNLNSLIKESYELLKHSFPPEISINLKLESKLWTIEADASQLSHVLMNFCVNARDAILEGNNHKGREISTESCGGTVTLETKNVELDEKSADRFLKATPGRYICLRVTDSGTGMTDEIMDRLFEPFFTTKKDQKSTGLGMSIIYGIIEKHNGFIDIQSELGKGSTFKVYFPVSDFSVIISDDEAARPVLSSAKETILIVDDESQLLSLFSRVLKKFGYKILTAENGKEAISIYNTQKDDIGLVILDMIMPEMGGKECFDRMRKINPDLKVLLSSGFTADSSVHDMLKRGAVGIIEKPFDLTKLSRAVREAFDEGSSAYTH